MMHSFWNWFLLGSVFTVSLVVGLRRAKRSPIALEKAAIRELQVPWRFDAGAEIWYIREANGYGTHEQMGRLSQADAAVVVLATSTGYMVKRLPPDQPPIAQFVPNKRADKLLLRTDL
jgi:hypothetical protein